MNEDIKDIIEILELVKEEMQNNDENITATLDLQDLKSLKNLYDLYNKEKQKNKELEEKAKLTMEVIGANYISKNKIKETAVDYEGKGYIEIAGAMRELLEERN